jgi:CHAT domain-containing protein
VLNDLSFAALTDGKEYFGDRRTIYYLPSASVLPFLDHRKRTSGERLLVMAYSEATGLPALLHGEREAEMVASIYATRPLVGEAASPSALGRAGEYDLLHVIAHYQPNRRNPLFSRIVLAPEKGSDGGFELHDVFELDLKASLVVLSICDGQAGVRTRGDEIAAMNRAFMYAGAPTVIASAWSADDQATRELMASFYGHLRQGMGKASALRAAQAETRLKHPNPYFWAGFMLTGDPGPEQPENRLATTRPPIGVAPKQ